MSQNVNKQLSEADTLKILLDENEEIIRQLTSDKTKLSSQLNETQKKLEMYKFQTNSLRLKLENKQTRNIQLFSQSTNEHTKALETDLLFKITANENLQNRIDQLENTINQVRKENRKLESTYKEELQNVESIINNEKLLNSDLKNKLKKTQKEKEDTEHFARSLIKLILNDINPLIIFNKFELINKMNSKFFDSQKPNTDLLKFMLKSVDFTEKKLDEFDVSRNTKTKYINRLIILKKINMGDNKDDKTEYTKVNEVGLDLTKLILELGDEIISGNVQQNLKTELKPGSVNTEMEIHKLMNKLNNKISLKLAEIPLDFCSKNPYLQEVEILVFSKNCMNLAVFNMSILLNKKITKSKHLSSLKCAETQTDLTELVQSSQVNYDHTLFENEKDFQSFVLNKEKITKELDKKYLYRINSLIKSLKLMEKKYIRILNVCEKYKLSSV